MRIPTTEGSPRARSTEAVTPLVRLLHLASPALPIGAFHFSQGLEYAVDAGWVGDESGAREWIAGVGAAGLATLDLPVLVVHGRQDPAVPALHATEIAAGFPRAGLRWVDNCGHFPHLEHAPVVNAWLAEFLVGRPAPR